MTTRDGTGLVCRAGYDRFLPLVLSLAINTALFAVAPIFLEQAAMPDFARNAHLNLLMPLREKTPPPEPESEPELPDEPPVLELAPMKPELRAELPDAPDMPPPKLKLPEPQVPETAAAIPDIPPIKSLATKLSPVQMTLSPSPSTSATAAAVSAPKPAPVTEGTGQGTFQPDGYEIGQVDVRPEALGQSLPAYPRKARRMGIEGWVKVRFLVNKEGGVEHLKILEESPADIFYKAVMSTVPGWRFRPAQKGGKAVDVWVEQTIKFKMETW